MLPDGSIDEENIEKRFVKHLRSLETWYTAELERRLKDLAEILNTELKSQVEELRTQYEQRYQDFQQKAARLPQVQSPPPEVFEEITRSEASVAKCAAELERLVADDSVALGQILKVRSQELELKAYIRGLKFLRAR